MINNIKIHLKIILFTTFLFSSFVFAQQNDVNTNKLIDCPTAFMVGKGNMDFGGRIITGGGMLSEVSIGLTDNFYFGVSYGGANIIGREDPVWNGNPGVIAKYLFVPEDYYLPSFTLGYNSQGYGAWSEDRYDIKSKGFYLVLSKNYFVSGNLGTLGFHIGSNYNVTEKNKAEDRPNFFAGFDKSIGKYLTLVTEFDMALNEDYESDFARTEGYGYLNIALRWSIYNTIDIEIDIKDILRNKKGSERPSRELRLMYTTNFF